MNRSVPDPENFFFHFLQNCSVNTEYPYYIEEILQGKQKYLKTGLFCTKQKSLKNRYILKEMEPGVQGKF